MSNWPLDECFNWMDGILGVCTRFHEFVMFPMKVFPEEWHVSNDVRSVKPYVKCNHVASYRILYITREIRNSLIPKS